MGDVTEGRGHSPPRIRSSNCIQQISGVQISSHSLCLFKCNILLGFEHCMNEGDNLKKGRSPRFLICLALCVSL